MDLEHLAPRLAHPWVRSLAWLIGSPGLLDAHDARFAGRVVEDAWCAQALAQAAPWLLELDREPRLLDEFIAAHATRRLGRAAETLLAFWLERQAGVEVLARNLAVRDAQRTLGEFDFIFREPGAHQATHWECAVKFYLRVPGAGGMACYVGPGDRDVLAAKVDKVFACQLMLGESPEGRAALRALHAEPARPQAFVKGWLFYEAGKEGADAPDALGLGARHLRGWWLRAEADWERRLEARRRYVMLPRLHWLAWPWHAAGEELLGRDALVEAVGQALSADAGAQMVIEMAPAEDGPGWREVSRGFVAPAGWRA